jgi:hypothetical protein
MKQFLAMVISSPEEIEMARNMRPDLKDVSDENLDGAYLIFGFPFGATIAFVRPENFHERFDHIENGPYIKLHTFFEKDQPTACNCDAGGSAGCPVHDPIPAA